jgi:hypothetical protein
MRSSVVAVAAAAALAGCLGPPSQIDAKSSVTLSGIVQTESGAASPSANVKLIRHPDPLQAIGQIFVAVGSIGLACIAGQLDICSAFEESQSAGDGSYSFAMRGADTQGSTGQALTFTVFASCPGGNCAVASDFQIQRTKLTIPPLRFWTELGTLDNGAANPRFAWPALEASLGGAPADGYRVSITGVGGAVVWQQDAQKATSVAIDRRVTQDLEGQWIVVAQRKEPGNGTDFAFNWYSSQQPYPNQNLVPLSRAADCFTQGADGMPSRLARPCPVTDGNPTTRFVPMQPPPCPMGQTCQTPPLNNWILIDIGFSHPLSLLVLYDLVVSNSTANMLVETSDDLMTWTLQQTLKAQPYQTTALTGQARFLRVRLSDPNAQFGGGGNSEIAIYAPF